MEIKHLEFKDYNHISFLEMHNKYSNISDEKFVKFTLDELKSLLALQFSKRYHFLNDENDRKILFNAIFNEKYSIINTTRDFGRQILENLDDYKKEWLNSLADMKYNFTSFMNEPELVEFVEANLLDYMTFRSFEYGEFFMRRFSREVVNLYNLDFYSPSILRNLKNEEYPLEKIAEKVYKNDSLLSTQEQLVLSFLLEEKLLKTKLNPIQYGLVCYIAKRQILKLHIRTKLYEETINKILAMKWNLNRGMGGPKRG